MATQAQDGGRQGQPLRVIHVGVGGRGRWPLEVVGQDPRLTSVALVDVVPEHLDQARAATGLPEAACFPSLQAALEGVAADALIVCTPTRTHAAFCRAGFGAGKHVLVEKGMTLDWAEARRLVEEAAAAGVAFCVAQNYRYMAEAQTLKRLLKGGTYGTPHLIDFIHHRYRPEPRTLDYPFAMVWDMSCHHFDNLVFWFGPLARVTAVAHNAPWSAYAHDAGVSAILEFQSGMVCTYELTHQATINDYRLLVQTERGALRWDAPHRQWGFTPRPERQFGPSGPSEAIESVPVGRSEQAVVDDWYAYITTGTEPGISGRRNLETLAVCEMVVRSATTRRPVERGDV
ncbi:MAG TPA: Gfo/Idh/MocA family oxidoreductase [Chloroflexota bacterium]|nr:Gfo/Idh/MocA family oxidoreductase [Chloroflexota bacterium]